MIKLKTNCTVLCETNVLNLISEGLDTIGQIKPKRVSVEVLHRRKDIYGGRS
jgi:hypothetical protein